MDPYCIIETRQQKFRTKVLQGAGKTPRWNEWFDVDVKYIGDDIHIKVLDEDVTDSDTIGFTTLKISALTANGGLDEWFPIEYKGKSAGTLHLAGQWKPHGVQQAVPVQAALYQSYAQPAQVNYMQP